MPDNPKIRRIRKGRKMKMKQEHFEGWYIRQQAAQDGRIRALALIPGCHTDENGVKTAILQVVTTEKSYTVMYPARSFRADPKGFRIRCGRNYFSKSGVILDIETRELSLHGRLYYSAFHSPKRPAFRFSKRRIPGPGCMIAGGGCRNEIVSIRHRVCGRLTLNGTPMVFRNGLGYIESERRASLPRRYMRTQCNSFLKESGVNGLMAAAAEISLPWMTFRSCACRIYYQGRGYRMATCLGARVLRMSERLTIIRQGQYRLIIHCMGKNPVRLKVPVRGSLKSAADLYVSCPVRYIFCRGSEVLFYETAEGAGYQYG